MLTRRESVVSATDPAAVAGAKNTDSAEPGRTTVKAPCPPVWTSTIAPGRAADGTKINPRLASTLSGRDKQRAIPNAIANAYRELLPDDRELDVTLD